jgi:hypothetical protein
MYTHKAIKVVKNGINIKKYIFFFSCQAGEQAKGGGEKLYISI